jgi:hypothetical protein
MRALLAHIRLCFLVSLTNCSAEIVGSGGFFFEEGHSFLGMDDENALMMLFSNKMRSGVMRNAEDTIFAALARNPAYRFVPVLGG